MIKNKKHSLIIIGAFILTLLLGTTTYAFFNYTRTGASNVINVGRISFNSSQDGNINLTNMFPIDISQGIPNDNTKVGTVTINITGDTTYSEGIEYLVSAVNVNNFVGNKKLPISIDVSVENNDNNNQITSLGNSDEDYYDNRGGESSIYNVLAKDTISNGDRLLVGYIVKGETGVDGNVVIKAYFNSEKIGISDTYPPINEDMYVLNKNITSNMINSCANYLINKGYDYYYQVDETMTSFCDGTGTLDGYNIDYWLYHNWFSGDDLAYFKSINLITEPEYYNGTTHEWASGKTILTTEEWNSFQQNGISFKIKVEANEGIWVEPNDSRCFTVEGNTITGYDETCGSKVYVPSEINGVTINKIGATAFYDKNLTSVSIADTVTTIESMAFQNNKIARLKLGAGVNEIGVRAFNNNLISSLVIPNSVRLISGYAFLNNRISGNLIIPSSVEEIMEYAFSNAGNFTNVTIPNSNTTYGDYVFKNSTIENLSVDIPIVSNNLFKEAGISNLIIGSHVENILQGAFENNNISSLSIPSNVRYIGNSFQYNHIADVTIPSTVETLSCYAFINQLDNHNGSITTNITYEQSGFTCTN